MKTYIISTLLFACCCTQLLQGQDMRFSRFYDQPLYLNPAEAAAQEGVAMHAIYRKQWPYVPGAFEQYGFSFHGLSAKLRSGFGLQLLHGREGEGYLSTTGIGLTYAYYVPLIDRRLAFYGGFQPSYKRVSIDWDRLVFSDQLDPVSGNAYASEAIPPNQLSRSYFDLSAGAMFIFTLGNTHNGRVGIRSKLGFAMHHIATPKHSLTDIESRLPRKYTLHAASKIPITWSVAGSKRLDLMPSLNINFQGGISSFQYGFVVAGRHLTTGFYYQNAGPAPYETRHTNALIVQAGIQGLLHEKQGLAYEVGISYDINASGLGTPSRGAFEVSLALRWEDGWGSKERKPSGQTSCPDF